MEGFRGPTLRRATRIWGECPAGLLRTNLVNAAHLWIVGLSLCSGLGMVVAAVPLAVGWTRRNRWYGFRTPATLNSDAVWQVANQAAGRALFVAGLCVITTSVLVVVFAARMTGAEAGIVTGVTAVLAVGLATLKGYLAERAFVHAERPPR